MDEHENRTGKPKLFLARDVDDIVEVSEICRPGCRHTVTAITMGGEFFCTDLDGPHVAWLAQKVGFAIGKQNHLSSHTPKRKDYLIGRPIWKSGGNLQQ